MIVSEKGNFYVHRIGDGPTHYLWAPGWGMTGSSFNGLAQSFQALGTSHLIDFPGFGQSPKPDDNWSTRQYADLMASWLKTLPADQPKIWIGHSFGCRVGIQLAAHYPGLVDKFVFIAPAGLRRKRPFHKKIYLGAKVRLFKLLKIFVPEGPARNALRRKFGSADYVDAGNMRQILLNFIGEDLATEAKSIKTPTCIICGAKDDVTPPNSAARLNTLISTSALHILDGFDHYTVLNEGRHQVAALIQGFVKHD